MQLSNQKALKILKDQKQCNLESVQNMQKITEQENFSRIRQKNRLYIYKSFKKQEDIIRQDNNNENQKKRANKSYELKNNRFKLGEDKQDDLDYLINLKKPQIMQTDQLNDDNSIFQEEINEYNQQSLHMFAQKQKFIQKNSSIIKRRVSCYCNQCGKIEKLKKTQFILTYKDFQNILLKSKINFDQEFNKINSYQNELIKKKQNQIQSLKTLYQQNSIKSIYKNIEIQIKQNSKSIDQNEKKKSKSKKSKISLKTKQSLYQKLCSEQQLQFLTKKYNQMDQEPELADLDFQQSPITYRLTKSKQIIPGATLSCKNLNPNRSQKASSQKKLELPKTQNVQYAFTQQNTRQNTENSQILQNVKKQKKNETQRNKNYQQIYDKKNLKLPKI